MIKTPPPSDALSLYETVQTSSKDRNFDKLVHKFESKVYDTLKGEWRLKLLKEDLQAFVASPSAPSPGLVNTPLSVWDAGCGFGQIGVWLAQAGHTITACDVSHQMLMRAQENFKQANVSATFLEGVAQALAPNLPQFDLVLFHAVLEWLAQPQATLKTVANQVKPGGHLSLLFYNRNSVVIRYTLKGAWRLQSLLSNDYMGKGKKLTPPNPQIPEEVCEWLADWGFEITVHTGIRIFHDYMTPEVLGQTDLDELFALEYRYCRTPTFRTKARYVHVLARRKVL
jgi:S-adenosylmethionine-dependent methyltransferase